MKIFAIFSKVIIEPKSEWLDSFREKYDESYVYHITLKQPCYAEEASIPDVKAKLEAVLKASPIEQHEIKLKFDSLLVNYVENDGMCIMLNSSNSPTIFELQKRIATALSEYDNRRKPESKLWEENFKPHITIGRKLEKSVSEQALKELPDDYSVHGKVTEVTLIVANDYNPAEVTNPKNMIVYRL